MQGFQTFLAPAKINLFLHITGQRADGYHLLQTVFCLLDFYDTIHLKPTSSKNIKRVNSLPDLPEVEDLTVRAATMLQTYSNCSMGVEIFLEKKIPIGGGLGGGSSDAATVLLALNHLWDLKFSRDELLLIALKLGADVPFFIHGKNAWAEGIGDQLQSIALNDAYYVVLTPEVHVSTQQVFANKQLTKNAIPKTISDFSGTGKTSTGNSALTNINAAFINQLEPVVCNEYPPVLACLSWLKKFGAARMSGSGASVFLEVPSEKVATEICDQKPVNVRGFVAKGLSQHPLFEYCS